MNEVDVDKDGMISMAEFLRSTKSEEFKNNEPWQALDNQTIYTEEELRQFQKDLEDRISHDEKPHETTFPSNNPEDRVDHNQQQQHTYEEKQGQEEGRNIKL